MTAILVIAAGGCGAASDSQTESRQVLSATSTALPATATAPPSTPGAAVAAAPPPTATPVPTPASIPTAAPIPTATSGPTPRPRTVPGLGGLVADDFSPLAGRRVAVIANQTSVFDGHHIIDLLHEAPDVELVAILAPEHGVRGDAQAGETIDDTVDGRTTVPIFSLYGATRKPTVAMLDGIDVVVYDLQDAGTRFYTFISTMGLAMQAAAEQDIDFMVLDRPNPQGGAVRGFVRDSNHESFVSQYPVPAQYGLTPGELALAIQGEGWLAGLDDLNLDVVPLAGWLRALTFDEIELDWIPPSPGLPTIDAVLAYPGTVLFEATTASYGVGTDAPFTTIGAPWSDGVALAAELNELARTRTDMAGIGFEPVDFTPTSAFAPGPRHENITMSGVRYVVRDPDSVDAIVTAVAVLQAMRRQGAEVSAEPFIDRPEFFDLLAGSTRLRTMTESDSSLDEIVAAWRIEAAEFDALTTRYHLYD